MTGHTKTVTGRRRGRRALLGCGVAAGLLLAAGCGGGDADAPVADAVAERGGTYRVAMGDFGFTSGFDPSGEYLGWSFGLHSNLLTRTLVGYRHTSGAAGTQLVPDLAEAIPEPTDGGTTWTFRIKPGVRFAPPVAREVTSRDIAYAFERIGTPSVVAQYGFYYGEIVGMSQFMEGKAKTISGITTPDDRTIVIRTVKPVGDMLYRLAMPATTPIPPEVGRCFEKAGEYGRYLIASGPYMYRGSEKLDITNCKRMRPIAGFAPASRISLVRNPNYDPATDSPEQREALPDSFEFTINTNLRDVYDRIERGLLEDSHDTAPPEVVRRYSGDQALRGLLRSNPDDSTRYVFMNLSEAPFDDVNVRRAVNWVMDKDAMRRTQGGELAGRIGTHIVPPSLYGGSPDIEGYDPYATPGGAGDPERARQEMRKSRYDADKDGRCDAPACESVLYLGDSTGNAKALTPIVEASLAKIGIRLKVRELPTGPAFETSGRLASRIQIGGHAGWGKDYPDPSTFFQPLMDGRNILPIGNAGYSLVGLTADQAKRFGIPYPAEGIPSVDARIDRCSALLGDERTACWVALDKTLMEDVVPWVPYLFANIVGVRGPAVTKTDFDQFSGATAYAHVAVDPSKQRR